MAMAAFMFGKFFDASVLYAGIVFGSSCFLILLSFLWLISYNFVESYLVVLFC
jgi:hypothetical protein